MSVCVIPGVRTACWHRGPARGAAVGCRPTLGMDMDLDRLYSSKTRSKSKCRTQILAASQHVHLNHRASNILALVLRAIVTCFKRITRLV